MPANMLDHALSKARVHRSGTLALLVMDGNGHLACTWSELLTAMRWAVNKPARPRAETCLELMLERLSVWIVSSQCSLAPKGATTHQWRLLCELKSAGLGDGVSWRVQKPAAPAMTQSQPELASVAQARGNPESRYAAAQPVAALARSAPAARTRNYTSPGHHLTQSEAEDADPSSWDTAEQRQERSIRGDCRGRVVEESRNGGLHIELSGD